MKKSKVIVSILSLSTIFALTTVNVFAEANDNESNREIKLQTTTTATFHGEHTDKQERDDRNNKMRGERDHQDSENGNEDDNEGEDDAVEMSLHDHVAQTSNTALPVSLPMVSSTSVNTYADMVSVLTQYQNAIIAITASGTLSHVNSKLSTQEQAVLGKLLYKHNDEFNRITARASDLSSQIKDLIDVLTPLGSTTITTSFNLKGLVVLQLKDFAEAINDLNILENTSVEIIDQETN